MDDSSTALPLRCVKPDRSHGSGMWELAKKTSLDLNSAYKYIMMAEYFADTCVAAIENEEVVGFITGFIKPDETDVLFIWQVGVDPGQRGKGLAFTMLRKLLQRSQCKDVRYVEATITADNKASQALFKKLAASFSTSYAIRETFPEEILPGDAATEYTYRIGPLPLSVQLKGDE
ncbi:diaminobutyrate acetyltransferase [Bacillus daqingensis]|uniref:L-2,4-diaminobutyric acid acetyltransferase n=1 Tax=Bacillus daqingensis TaxID=872396 RepID=A0ABV9NUM7_9BACI